MQKKKILILFPQFKSAHITVSNKMQKGRAQCKKQLLQKEIRGSGDVFAWSEYYYYIYMTAMSTSSHVH